MNYPLNKMANRFYGRDLASVAFQQVMEITEDICSDAVENDELTEQARSANDEFQALVNGSLGLESLSDKSLRFLLWLLNGIILPIFAAAMGGIIATQYINDKALALGLAKNNREVKTLVRCYSNEEKMALSGCRVVLGDGIRVRATPGLKGNVIATLPVGKIVTILDSTQRAWLLIEADIDGETVEGWVSRRYTVPFR
ncbi:MAG: SH3 domain-containing protein [Chromatiales bacterium]|nr:SH3 domain-containing protein [Chromatiales bacterium]